MTGRRWNPQTQGVFGAGVCGPGAARPVVGSGVLRKTIDFEIYRFVQADAIYDFKRVDPDWNATLRVSTIPTWGEPCGGDGESDPVLPARKFLA